MADGSAVVVAQDDFLTLKARELPAFGQYRRASDEPCLIAAESDRAAVHAWLNDRARSPHTRESYYKEAARLIVWASSVRRVPLSGLTREDLGAFLEFVRDLPAEWTGKALARKRRDGSQNPNWKPFVGPLSENSIAQMLRVITAMYGYWHKCNYIVVNPLAIPLGQAPVTAKAARTERYLEPATWNYLMSFIDALPRSTWPETQYSERVRWIFHFAYLSGARVSEMASAKMSDFMKELGVWWLSLNGKGGKLRRVPVSDEFLAALRRYRLHLAMSALPTPHEHKHAIRSLSGNRGLTPKSIYLVVKEVCEAAADAIKLQDPAMAHKLSLASTHWLRHTSASHRVNSGQDIRHVQQLLGHADLNTTMIYQHAEELEFHEAISALTVRPSNK